ncbi:NADPH:quinone oxidoreductase family protein [Ponticaulis sp.]|uniref:NADPH:quinone oxidoreductase family protein n=1 Tax=Ponticaulis sp. TaxID=2020902 RepID=UPI000B72D615|nr:NADPH:quinone oxidoreductase family protein [Ponticaulis sp.]MAI90939.1 NADPH:quinone oxidoreductase [Ponticaulis sp.]OUX98282.1 MAG: NADPH:quinone oxidoreductase [Hyphomonadaceae bacterium TMED5]|tara:strand:+ start:23737 stop:24732 length:996 start_codon:yes stop_codon:yes gene_type:complete
MKAVVSKQPGGPETLEMVELDSPKPGPKQVVLEIKAIGVNFPDSLIIVDRYQFKPDRPFSPGGEVAGVVKEVGSEVTSLKPGDRVIGSCGWGGMREEIAIEADRCLAIPDEMPFDEASAFILTYGTSYYGLKRRGDPKPGETLFILGAAGGVGVAAIELGKAMGLKVIAACSSQEKVDFCLSKGADVGLIYPMGDLDRDQQKELSNQIKEVSGGGVDIIYDAVGGAYAEPSLRALNWEGRYLVIGFPAGIPKIPLNLTLLKSCDIRGVFWGAWVRQFPGEYETDVQELFDFYKDSKIKPHVSKTFPLDQSGDAIQHLMDRKATGKVVVLTE